MVAYDITFARSARKDLERLSRSLRERVFHRIELLATNPRPSGCKRLAGADDLWRIRIGDFRVIYSVDDAGRIVDISAVRHRAEAYR